MKNMLCRALAIGALFLAGAGTLSAAFLGAIYTSTFDGSTVNANNFENCRDVYLNGGPQNLNAAGLPIGEYYFQVTNPNGSVLLSTTPAFQRRVQVVLNAGGKGVIFGRAPGLNPLGYVDVNGVSHLDGLVDLSNGSKPVQLWHFDPTPNNGGVYKVWLIPVGLATVGGDGISLTFANSDSKTDNFRCVHDDPGGPSENNVIIGGRKYYDGNANGQYDVDSGEEWTDGDGRPRVTIQLCYTAPAASEVCVDVESDSGGTWGWIIPEGSTFTACEIVPDTYTQTGPLDGDSTVNGDASATATDGCWDGAVTTVGLGGLDFGNVNVVTISGMKFYDANADGLNDAEAGIEGFKIVLSITYPDQSNDVVCLYTDSNGEWSYEVPVGSSVAACEVMPLGTWIQTAPGNGGCYEFTANADTSDLDFGNVCLGPGGGKTLGFWSNKNGEAQMKDGGTLAPELAELAALNLRNANGTDFNPGNYAAFRTWILGATATNMANMLSAQMAAMYLNREAGFVSGGAIVWNSCTGFITIDNLISAANSSLGSWGLTLSGHPQRANQECMKTTLDQGNNNLNFVQATACEVVYPE